MPLQIRRGTAAALSSITPAQGEPLYTTDTKQLFFGDGSTAGGLAHTHAIADVTNLQTTLNGKAASSHTHAAGDITSGVLGAARLGTGTANNTTFLRGDGTWAVPAGGGGGSDGTVPLITQAYAVTEGYGLGDFQTYLLGTGYVRPVTAQTYGAFIDRAGALEVGVTQTQNGGPSTTSGQTASLGGFTSISGTIYRCAASLQLARNTITAVVRLPSAPTGSSTYQAGVAFTDIPDFLQTFGFTGAMGVSVYVGPASSNWMVRYAGGEVESGFLSYTEFDTGVARSTAWRTIQIITETVAGTTTYTIKIGGATVHTITSATLLNSNYIDMNYAYFCAPHVAVRSFGTSANPAMITVDHLSILSEVTR